MSSSMKRQKSFLSFSPLSFVSKKSCSSAAVFYIYTLLQENTKEFSVLDLSMSILLMVLCSLCVPLQTKLSSFKSFLLV